MPYLRRDLGLASLVLGSRYRAQTGPFFDPYDWERHSTVVLPAGLPEVVTRLVRITQYGSTVYIGIAMGCPAL